MRTPVLAANWKMYKTIDEAVAFTAALREQVKDVTDAEVVLSPPFTAVRAVADAARGTRLGIAGQDLFWETQGAFTGEVSAGLLKDAGATYVIIGHSERRHLFGETDAAVNAKVRAALTSALTPIICVGETLEERESNRTLAVLDRQITEGLTKLTAEEAGGLIVAYEPIWAIGTGRSATPAQAQETHASIRARLEQAFGRDAAARCRVIYGGSVKPENIRELSTQPDVDGALVGGASLDPSRFAQIVAGGRPTPV